MGWMEEPVSAQQAREMLDRYDRVGILARLRERGGPIDWTLVRELVDRLRLVADPDSGEEMTQGEMLEAINTYRANLQEQMERL